MAKFKVGDKVRIVANECGHGHAIGDVVTITAVNVHNCDYTVPKGLLPWVVRDSEITLVTDAPKLWRDMTAEEKGALLLAKHDEKDIEVWRDGEWFVAYTPAWFADKAYRVRAEPVAPVVTTLVVYAGHSRVTALDNNSTHRIVVTMHDGVPVSVALEPL